MLRSTAWRLPCWRDARIILIRKSTTGIDRLIQSYNMVIVSEDAVAPLAEMPTVNVLNQWTYHSRM